MTTKCPCGGETTADLDDVGFDEGQHWLWCGTCSTSGPYCPTPEAADAAWCLLTGQPAPGVVELALRRLELRSRDRKGFTALARELGVSRTTLDRWESGATAVSDEHRAKLMRLIVST